MLAEDIGPPTCVNCSESMRTRSKPELRPLTGLVGVPAGLFACVRCGAVHDVNGALWFPPKSEGEVNNMLAGLMNRIAELEAKANAAEQERLRKNPPPPVPPVTQPIPGMIDPNLPVQPLKPVPDKHK